MLDTDQLRSFLAIVDTGSFTRAAERVHKTQSAVSMHVRRLEEQLGCALFVKQGRGARLTAEGESLIDYARRIVHIEAGAIAALSRKGLRGAVRLGIPDDYAETYLAEILGRFTRRHPLVEVSVSCEGSPELTQAAVAGRARARARHRPSWASTASSSCANSRSSGRPPSASTSTPERRSRWRSAPCRACGGATPTSRSPNPSARRAACSSPRTFPPSERWCARGWRRRRFPNRWWARACAFSGPEEGLPALPPTRMGLIHAPGHPTEETKALAEAIRETVSLAGRRAAA